MKGVAYELNVGIGERTRASIRAMLPHMCQASWLQRSQNRDPHD